MKFNEAILKLEKYLYSIRKLKTYLSVDLVLPTNWIFPKSLVESLQVAQSEGADGSTITSFVSTFKDSNKTLEIIFKLINYNLELEEKDRLLKAKVAELKEVFKSTNLEKLKTLEFKVPGNEIELDDNMFINESAESTKGTGVVE